MVIDYTPAPTPAPRNSVSDGDPARGAPDERERRICILESAIHFLRVTRRYGSSEYRSETLQLLRDDTAAWLGLRRQA